MNPFGGMIKMNRMIPAGLGGRRKTSQLNPLEGDPSEMRYARHGHEFNGVNPVQRGKEVGDPQITQIDADYLSLTENTEAQRERTGGLENIRFRTTMDIIEAAEKGLLPDKVMLNIHPQRWDDKPWPWVKELVWQNVKNVIKKYFLAK